MLPILNIALRSCRSASEYLVQSLDKRDPAQATPEQDEKLISHLEEVIFKSLLDAMKKAHPAHYVANPGEELRAPKEDSWHLLGFHNEDQLLRKIPFTGFSIVHRHKGKTQNAIIYNPLNGDEFTASRGGGAALNGRRIRCTPVKSLSEANVASNALNKIKDNASADAVIELTSTLSKECKQIHVTGCDALDICMTASGQIDASLTLAANVDELEAALFLARECGVLTGALSGDTQIGKGEHLITANPKLFKLLVQRFSSFNSKI